MSRTLYSPTEPIDFSTIEAWLALPPRAAINPFRLWRGAEEPARDIVERDVYRVQHHAPVQLEREITWTEDPFKDRNWCWAFHSLCPVAYLTQAAVETGDAKFVCKARALVESWIAAHIESEAAHAMTWHPHALALRAMVLLYFGEGLRQVAPPDEAFARRLLEAIVRHGELLTAPDLYQPAHNHGIDQDRALISIAVLLPDRPEKEHWLQLGLRRLEAQIGACITPEGVHFEHSPDYDDVVFRMLADLDEFLRAHDISAPVVGRTARALVRKLTFTLRPDGTFPPVGDTVSRRPDELEAYVRSHPQLCLELLYSITGGREGEAPDLRHLILPRSGCAIFRGSWDRATFREAFHCYFTAAFNTRTHKHHDDLSFTAHAFAHELLVDGGRYSYNYDDPYREYVQSVHAHNVVIINGQDTSIQRVDVGKSGISSFFEGRGVVAVDGVHYLYGGVECRRLLVYLSPDLLLVFDRAYGEVELAAEQQFLFAPELDVTVRGGGVDAAPAGGAGGPGARMIQLLAIGGPIRAVRGQREPLRGWVSRRHGQIEPCTAVLTPARGSVVAYVTAFAFQKTFDPDIAFEGRAEWDGTNLRCRLEVGERVEELLYVWRPESARLVCHGSYESPVWPTPFEEQRRVSLAVGRAIGGAPAGSRETEPRAEGPAGDGMLDLRVAEARHEVRIVREKLARAEGQIAGLSRRLTDVEQNRVLNELRDALDQRRTERQAELAAWRTQATTARERAKQAERKAAELAGEKKRLDRVVGRLEARLGRLRREFAAAQEKVANLTQAKAADAERIRRLQSDVQTARAKQRQAAAEAREAASSVRWRIGDAFVSAMRPSLDTLKLPVRLVRLLFEGRRRRRQRAAGLPTSETPAPPDGGTAEQKAASGAAPAGAAPPEITIEPSGLPSPLPRHTMRVACVLDEFSYECFAPECRLTQLTPQGWKREIEQAAPHLLLVESAWRGKGELWRHLVASTERWGDGPLREIVAHCRQRGIPAVFWNKEDPANYEHFERTAAWFDVIFTTDAGCVDRYRRAAGHERVFVLPFAAQPRLHNPLGRREGELGNVCFAGTWYSHKHDGRREDAELILDPALEFGLHIYDRMHGYSGPGWRNYQYPAKYEPAIRGGLPYRLMLEVYKRYHVFLNLNSVRNSPTMLARRVFEILACGTNVVSAYSPAIENLLGVDCVFLSRSADQTRAHLERLLGDETLRNRASARAVRRVLAGHTCAHRLGEILRAVGLDAPRLGRTVTILLPVSEAKEAEAAQRFLAAQSYPHVEPIWATTDAGFVPPGDARVVRVGASETMAGALDRALAAAGGSLLMRWGPRTPAAADFVADLAYAFEYFDGDAAGKPDGEPADRLLYRAVERLPLERTVLTMEAARRVGGAGLADAAAFEAGCRAARLLMLATDTVDGGAGESGADSSAT